MNEFRIDKDFDTALKIMLHFSTFTKNLIFFLQEVNESTSLYLQVACAYLVCMQSLINRYQSRVESISSLNGEEHYG